MAAFLSPTRWSGLVRYNVLRVQTLCSFNAQSKSTISADEIENFSKFSSEWFDERGPFKALYAMNRLRIPLITADFSQKDAQSQNSLVGKRIVDVGCGGGILSFSLARLGSSVVGIDASSEVVKAVSVAAENLRKCGLLVGDVSFQSAMVENFAKDNAESFDAVVASEILEHVADVELFVESCTKLARKNANIYFTTINKTLMSKVVAIWLAEDLLKIVPANVHDWSKFVEPGLIQQILERNGCRVRLVHGMVYNPLTNHWSWTSNTAVSYAVVAKKL